MPREVCKLEELATVQCKRRRKEQKAGLRRSREEDSHDKTPDQSHVSTVLERSQEIRHNALTQLSGERKDNSARTQGTSSETRIGGQGTVQSCVAGFFA